MQRDVKQKVLCHSGDFWYSLSLECEALLPLWLESHRPCHQEENGGLWRTDHNVHSKEWWKKSYYNILHFWIFIDFGIFLQMISLVLHFFYFCYIFFSSAVKLRLGSISLPKPTTCITLLNGWVQTNLTLSHFWVATGLESLSTPDEGRGVF